MTTVFCHRNFRLSLIAWSALTSVVVILPGTATAAVVQATSTEFAGYSASPAGGFDKVTATLTVPSITCDPNSNEVLGVKTGLFTTRLAHTAVAYVLAQCFGGREYFGTLQVGAKSVSLPLKAGAVVTLTISTTPASTTAALTDAGAHISTHVTSQSFGGSLNSFQIGDVAVHEIQPQVVQLAPPPSRPVTFTGAHVGSVPLPSLADLRQVSWMNGPDLIIQPSQLAGSSFTDTYKKA